MSIFMVLACMTHIKTWPEHCFR